MSSEESRLLHRPVNEGAASCADLSPGIFHEKAWDGSARTASFGDAQQICAVCPVRSACLEYALSLDDVEGVFAGYDPNQIRRMKRNRDEARM